MNRLLQTHLLLLKDGTYREVQEWSEGWDLVQTQFNGNPTWHKTGSYQLGQDYYEGAYLVREGLRFVELDSRNYFEDLESVFKFYSYNMRNPSVEHLVFQAA
jgi:hypothetical protein